MCIGWSGCNSTLESLVHDLPIVTMTGNLMRGRHTTAILEMMGIGETTAQTIDEYVSIAVELAQNPRARIVLKTKISQNKHRHLACQFTFACDNNKDVIREPEMWERARKIAKAMLDGQLWLPEVNRSTHYHAYWVRPSWVNEMKRMYKFGVHTFYRPRAWGDGSDAPSWGTAAETAAISAKLAEAAQSSAEQASVKR